jgi:site-specific DNA recombinase
LEWVTEPTQEISVAGRESRVPRRPLQGRIFGYSADRTKVVEEEACAIREAASRVLAGETLSSIVQEWNRRGLVTAKGGPWRVNSLSGLLVHPRLVAFPPIIDSQTHARLVSLHASRSKGRRRRPRKYLLTGLLRCGRCGNKLHGTPRPPGADLYICPGPAHGGCSGTAVTAEHAEDAIRDMVLARLDGPDVRLDGPDVLGGEVDGRDVAQQLAVYREQLQDLSDLWASGELSREEWLSLKRNVGERVRAAEAEVARLARISALQRLVGSGRVLRQRWPGMSIDERRAIVQVALEYVAVLPAEPPRAVFRRERLRPCWVGDTQTSALFGDRR